MIGIKFIAWMAAIVVAAGAPLLSAAWAAEGESPKSPIRVNTVDYVKADEGPGTLKLDGIAIAGSDVYIFVDDKPLARAVAADDGTWSIEEKTALDDKVHTVRVEQYDMTTRMLAARAQFNIALSKPDADADGPEKAEP